MPRLPIAELIGAISEAARAAHTTPVAEQAAKTAAELKGAVPEITQHLPDVPYAGSAKLKPYVRATAPGEEAGVKEFIQTFKQRAGGLFNQEPNLPKEYQKMFLEARYKVASAQERADQTVHDRITSKLEGDVGAKARLVSDYLTLADEFSDLHSKFTKDPATPVTGRGGATIDEIETDLHKVFGELSKHPDAVQASQGFRSVSDELFQQMVQYGLITPMRYRKNWTPRQQVMKMARGLSEAYGESSVGGEVLAQMQARTMTGGVTETNMVKVLRSVLKDFYEKVAGDQLVLRILSDPAINRTADFKIGERLPRGWVEYRPRPGLPGWKIPEQEAHVAAGVAEALGVDPRTLRPGGAVIPDDMARRLENFYPQEIRKGTIADTAYESGRFMARAFTVYNPANTALNVMSDASVALLGMPGEKANPLGFLRFYPGAFMEAARGAFGGRSEVFDRAVAEGLGSATYVESVSGAQVPEKLAAAMGETPSKNPLSHAANAMRRARLAVEMAPRIAAGQAAEHATGNPAEFGRVGREITLPYGAGAPAATRAPLLRWAAPFMQFIGLASERVGKLLVTPGSRTRAWTAMLAVPTAAFMWNRQNEAFREVEMSLRQRDRYSLHIIAPGENGQPYLDRNGKPVVLRIRYFVPEEVASMFGVSNLPGRIEDIVRGRVTPGEAVGAGASQALEQAGQQFVPGQVVTSLATGRDALTGEERPRAEIARRTIPIVRQFEEGVRGVQNAGPLEGVKRLGEEVSSIRFINPVRKGRADADITDLQFKLKEARSRMRSAFRKGDRARANEYKTEIYKIANRIRAINKARRKGRAKK